MTFTTKGKLTPVIETQEHAIMICECTARLATSNVARTHNSNMSINSE